MDEDSLPMGYDEGMQTEVRSLLARSSKNEIRFQYWTATNKTNRLKKISALHRSHPPFRACPKRHPKVRESRSSHRDRHFSLRWGPPIVQCERRE